MKSHPCARPGCTQRAHVLLGGERVCWSCYNTAVLTSSEKVQAKMLRRYYR